MLSSRDISLTFAKGLAVLRVFDEKQTQMSIADIARETGLDPATARRLVLTLVHAGYVRRDHRHFSLTPRILVLASGFLRGNQFGKFIQPILNHCAAETGLAVSLSMPDGTSALLVAQSTLHSTSITYGFTIGSRLPLLHTAIGRMLLAYGDAAWAEANLDAAPLEAMTPDSLTDRARIRAAVEQAAENGVAVVRGEFEAEVTGIAVAVGAKGSAKAVLGVSELSAAFSDPGKTAEIIAALRRSAIELRRTNVF